MQYVHQWRQGSGHVCPPTRVWLESKFSLFVTKTNTFDAYQNHLPKVPLCTSNTLLCQKRHISQGHLIFWYKNCARFKWFFPSFSTPVSPQIRVHYRNCPKGTLLDSPKDGLYIRILLNLDFSISGKQH